MVVLGGVAVSYERGTPVVEGFEAPNLGDRPSHRLLPSENGTHKTVKARFWPSLESISGESPFLSSSLLAQRPAGL